MTAVVGFAIVVVLLACALFADALAPQSPTAADQMQTFQRPSWAHPLGTDQLGRDMLSRVIHGTRIALIVGVSSVLLALFVGVPILGWGLVWLVIALAALNLFVGFCAGCAVYYWLGKLRLPGFVKTPPPGTFPGMRPKNS